MRTESISTKLMKQRKALSPVHPGRLLAAGFLILAIIVGDAWAQPAPAVVSGTKYEDLNADGNLGDGVPAAGVTILLLSGDGQFLIDTEVTDGSGYYEFQILEPGDHLVCEEVSAGWFQSAPGNSDCGGIPGAIGDGGYALTVELGMNYAGNNFGNWRPGTIDGNKYEDLDGDGITDPGEPGLAGVQICAGDTCAVTDQNGYYNLELPPGQYTVCEFTEPEWTQSSPANADCAGVDGAQPGGHTEDLSSGELESLRDFTNFISGSIHPLKFNDLNEDGVRDQGEPGLAGIEFELTGVNGFGQQVGPIVEASDENGFVWFLDIDPGGYVVTEMVPPGQLPSTPTSQDLILQSREEFVTEAGAAMLPNGSPRVEVVVGAGLMFGNYVDFATMIGYKFEDLDGDGVLDGGEPPLADWNIHLLFLDDTLGWVELDTNTFTDDAGVFSFQQAPLQTYAICEVAQDDWVQSFPTALTIPPQGSIIDCAAINPILAQWGYEITPDPGVTLFDIGFGNFVPGSIHPQKFEDLDADGVFDQGEPPLAGFDFELTGVTGAGEQVGPIVETSDADGNVWFLDLAPGSYSVMETVPDDWVLSTLPNARQYFVTSRMEIVAEDGQADLPLDSPRFEFFVGDDLRWGNYQYASVTACKHHDTDTIPGTEDDRVPLPGWTVQLSEDGVIIATDLTGEDGCFTWDDLPILPPGSYYDIHEVLQESWSPFTPTSYDCPRQFSGDNCSFTFVNMEVVPIPTLNAWMLMLLALMLGGFGLYRARERY